MSDVTDYPAASWPSIRPLPPVRPAPPPFDFNLLPDALRPWVCDVAERVQCPPDFCAVTAMWALSVAVGRRVGVRPKRHDDWTAIPNLWCVLIGRPGVMKSPAMREMLRPLRRLEADARDAHAADLAEHEAHQRVLPKLDERPRGRSWTSSLGEPVPMKMHCLTWPAGRSD